MKRILLFTIPMLGFMMLCRAQTISSAHFRISDHAEGIQSIELILNNVIVGISGDGDISYVEENQPSDYTRDFNYPGNEYSGNLKITYYDYFESSKTGKIKFIGDILVNYNDVYDAQAPMGKLKSIGNIEIKYNDIFDAHDKRGTFKSIGDIPITYYNIFDGNDPQNKVKSIGKVRVVYFNKFDAEQMFGKIKSIKGNSRSLYVTK